MNHIENLIHKQTENMQLIGCLLDRAMSFDDIHGKWLNVTLGAKCCEGFIQKVHEAFGSEQILVHVDEVRPRQASQHVRDVISHSCKCQFKLAPDWNIYIPLVIFVEIRQVNASVGILFLLLAHLVFLGTFRRILFASKLLENLFPFLRHNLRNRGMKNNLALSPSKH